MRRQLPAALGMLLLFTVLTGVVYPLAVTGVARIAFADRADGSLVTRDDRLVGSALLAQEFTGEDYFHPRPSAIGYDARDSGGANLGPSNPAFLEAVEAASAAYREENGLGAGDQVPVDAVTMSASGLDPHISVRNAELQAPRVASARRLTLEQVLVLVEKHTIDRTWGFLGESGVDVLGLNLALDDLAPATN